MTTDEKEQNKAQKKKIILITVAFLAGISLSTISSAYLLSPVNSSAVITELNGKVYRAQITSISGKILLVSSRSESVADRKNALSAQLTKGYSIVLTNLIASIDFTTEQPTEEPEKKSGKTKKSSGSIVGAYAVNVSGHRGTMSIFSQNGRYEGYIQFPNWAKGARETMKKIRISENTLYFTRSVETVDEQKRTGAPSLFVQNFEGDITNGGKTIKGFFSNHGGKEIWQAERR